MSTPGENQLRFDYRPNLIKMIIAVAFFGVGGFMLQNEASTNTRGLIIDGIIHLSPANASTFYLVLSYAGFAIMAFAIFATLTSLMNPKEIVLEPTSLSAPRWVWSSGPTRIPYKDITGAHNDTSARPRVPENSPSIGQPDDQRIAATIAGGVRAIAQQHQRACARGTNLNRFHHTKT